MNKIFKICLVYRLISIFAVQTFFVPDEYWQSLEIAHKAAFGYGHQTWEFDEKIRSSTYPSLFFVVFKILKIIRLDYLPLLIYFPRLLQAAISAIADACYYRLCSDLTSCASKDIWLSIIFDWFLFYCGSRTLINTLECNLVLFALYNFSWEYYLPNKRVNVTFNFTAFVCLCCLIRPTACIIWLPFILFWMLNSSFNGILLLIKQFTVVGILLSATLILLDSIFYGSFTVTLWNFLNFNVVKGISSFYGSHPYYWYLQQGIPVVLGVYLVPFCLQIFHIAQLLFKGAKTKCDKHRSWKNQTTNHLLLVTIGSSILLYSFIPHKEFRFLLPLLPMMKILAIQGVKEYFTNHIAKLFHLVLILSFIVLSTLFGMLHQRGTLNVMSELASDSAKHPNATSILILTPCHATPLYSHIHVNVTVRFITCLPPITESHHDESEEFFKNSKSWLDSYWTNNSQPSHIVMFDNLAETLHRYILKKGFIKATNYFHTLFPDGRVGSYIILYKEKGYPG